MCVFFQFFFFFFFFFFLMHHSCLRNSAKTACLKKNLVLELQTKMLLVNQILRFFELQYIKSNLRYEVIFFCMVLTIYGSYRLIVQFILGVVRHVQACQKSSEITYWQYFWRGLSYSVDLLHVVRHSWKLQFDHVFFIEFSQASPKCSEITNKHYGSFKKVDQSMLFFYY